MEIAWSAVRPVRNRLLLGVFTFVHPLQVFSEAWSNCPKTFTNQNLKKLKKTVQQFTPKVLLVVEACTSFPRTPTLLFFLRDLPWSVNGCKSKGSEDDSLMIIEYGWLPDFSTCQWRWRVTVLFRCLALAILPEDEISSQSACKDEPEAMRIENEANSTSSMKPKQFLARKKKILVQIPSCKCSD